MRSVCMLLLAIASTGALPLETRGADLKLAWEFAAPKSLPLAAQADERGRPFLYLALKHGGFGVLDTSRPDAAKEVARIEIAQFKKMDVMNLAQRGDLLLLALGDHFGAMGTKHAGLAVVNVSDPRRPQVLSVWQSAEKLKGGAVVAAEGRYAYLGVMAAGVMLFDISDPKRIEHISTYLPDVDFPRKNPNRVQHPNARGLAIRGDLLFVANDAGGLRVLNVRDRRKPREVGRYINRAMGGKQQAYNNVVLDGKRAYLAIDYAGLEILDISNPSNIRQLGWWNPWDAHTLKNLWFNSPGHTNQLQLDAREKRVYLSAGDSELLVVDVSSPARPRRVDGFGKPKNRLGVWGLAVSKDHVFLTYIKTVVPFRGTWSGIKAVQRR